MRRAKVLATVIAALFMASCTASPTAVLIDPNTGNYKLAKAPDLEGAATPGAEIWRAPDIANYPAKGYFIPPATIYKGPRATFAGLGPAQQEEVAAYLTTVVRQTIGQHFPIVDGPGPGIHRLELIIARIIPPHPTALPATPNWEGTIIGHNDIPPNSPGLFVVGGKFYDTTTGKELAAFLAPVQPASYLEPPRTTGTEAALEFARIASAQLARDLADSLVRQRSINERSRQGR